MFECEGESSSASARPVSLGTACQTCKSRLQAEPASRAHKPSPQAEPASRACKPSSQAEFASRVRKPSLQAEPASRACKPSAQAKPARCSALCVSELRYLGADATGEMNRYQRSTAAFSFNSA